MRIRSGDIIALVVVAAAAAVLARDAAPFGPVDSPFPAEGLWLLVTHESRDHAAVRSAANAESVRRFPGLNRRVLDIDETPSETPWTSAINHARIKSDGEPYFVARKGRRVAEGPLTGSVDQMHATLNSALEGLSR